MHSSRAFAIIYVTLAVERGLRIDKGTGIRHPSPISPITPCRRCVTPHHRAVRIHAINVMPFTPLRMVGAALRRVYPPIRTYRWRHLDVPTAKIVTPVQNPDMRPLVLALAGVSRIVLEHPPAGERSGCDRRRRCRRGSQRRGCRDRRGMRRSPRGRAGARGRFQGRRSGRCRRRPRCPAILCLVEISSTNFIIAACQHPPLATSPHRTAQDIACRNGTPSPTVHRICGDCKVGAAHHRPQRTRAQTQRRYQQAHRRFRVSIFTIHDKRPTIIFVKSTPT